MCVLLIKYECNRGTKDGEASWKTRFTIFQAFEIQNNNNCETGRFSVSLCAPEYVAGRGATSSRTAAVLVDRV